MAINLPLSARQAWILFLLVGALTSFMLQPAHASGSEQFHTVSMAIPPWMSAKTNRILVKQINDHGFPHKLRVRLGNPADYRALVQSGVQLEYDFLILPQHIALYLWKHHNYRIIVSGKMDAGIVFITANPTIKSINQLTSKRIGFPDPIAYVTIAAQRFFSDKNLHYESHYLARHDAVLSHPLRGEIDAGAVVEQALHALDKTKRAHLNRIHTMQVSSLALVLAKSDIQQEVIDKMTQTLLSTNNEKLKLFPAWSIFSETNAQSLYDSDLNAIEVIKAAVISRD